MRPRIIVVGNRIDIEKHGARNMRAEIIVRRQRQHPGILKDASMILTFGSSIRRRANLSRRADRR
jgi:hypothetical protein